MIEIVYPIECGKMLFAKSGAELIEFTSKRCPDIFAELNACKSAFLE